MGKDRKYTGNEEETKLELKGPTKRQRTDVKRRNEYKK